MLNLTKCKWRHLVAKFCTNARIFNTFMWGHLLTKFASYKVLPVMVSTHGSVVPLAMFHLHLFAASVLEHAPLEAVYIYFDTATYDEIERDVKVQKLAPSDTTMLFLVKT